MKFKKSLIISCFLFILIFLNSCIFTLRDNNSKDEMLIHYINVGQGDSILIQVNNKNLLIDSGPKEGKKSLITYLDKLNIKKLDYVIATHPHDDHIGNMSTIIKKYNIEKFYAPKVNHTSITFENMVTSLVDKNLKIHIIEAGCNTIDLGKNTKFLVFSPPHNFTSDNLNEYSPIIKIQYLNTSFLFTGDAESSNEKEVIINNYNLKCDVLKLGHHGSSTSTCREFYQAVNPSIVVISVGNNNKYNHPSYETLQLLNEKNPLVYRTDINSTIVLKSDGNTIKYIKLK